LQPNNPTPRVNYGLAPARVHRTEEARREIEALLRMDPDTSLLMICQGACLWRETKFSRLSHNFAKAF
jgi:hypothetical protein